MPNSEKPIAVLGVTVFLAIVGVGLVVTAVASDHWVRSDLRGNETDNRTESAEMKFGLFNGEGNYDVGLSERPFKLEINCDLSESICGYINTKDKKASKTTFESQVKLYLNGTKDLETYGLFGFALFATTLVMLCLSMVFGLLCIGFSLFNVFGRPIESITGMAGLYLWNALGLIFVLTGMGVYMGLFFTQVSDMIPHMKMFLVDGTTWIHDTDFDWSFYCIVGAAAAYLINIFLLILSGKKCPCNYSNVGEKEMDNGIILY